MTRDFFFGIFISCLLFSCLIMYYLQLSLLKGCVTKQCNNECLVVMQQNEVIYSAATIRETSLTNAANSKVASGALILLWTPLRDYIGNWEEHFGPNWGYFEKCGKNDSFACTISSDRSRLEQSSLVLFNMNDLRIEQFSDRPSWIESVLPPLERANDMQRWALFWRESPGKIIVPGEKLHWLDGLFNWTISYRRDSDIFYPFGFFQEIPHRNSLRTSFRRLWKRQGIAWYSNTCETPSRRESLAMAMEALNNGSFIAQLYGKCVDKMPKLKKGKTFMEAASRRVKFYLAAEEEICDDYITEMYFDSLHHSYVPVVFGGPDVGYDEVGLAGTYIDALDFPDEQELVNYLTSMTTESAEEFLQYLAWQYDYAVLPALHWVCDLRLALEKEVVEKTVIANFTAFWNQKKCYGSYSEANFHDHVL